MVPRRRASPPSRLAGVTAALPKRRTARSAAWSASAQPCSRSPSRSWRSVPDRGRSPSSRTPTSRMPGALEPQGLEQRGGLLVDLAGDVGRLAQGARPGERGEVGEADRHRHRAPDHLGRAHPGADPRRETQQLAQHDLTVVGVASEGLVGAHAAVRGVVGSPRLDHPVVAAPGQPVQVAAPAPDPGPGAGSPPGCARGRPRWTGRAGAAPDLGLLPYALELPTRAGAGTRSPGPGARRRPRRAWQVAGQLGHRHRARDPDRAGDALLVVDRARISSAIRRGVPSRRRTR